MSSFLKSIFHSSNKHKKLSEEWTSSREPVVDGVTFYVRYLGSSLVEDPKCAQSTTAGVKRVIHAAKAGARRPERVAFRVAMEGVRVDSTTTGATIMDTSIYKISYCSADSQYEQILAFVASNDDDRCECHAFLCSKRKVAEAIAVSIAHAFTMAYECWKRAIEAKKNGETSLTSEETMDKGDGFPSRGGCSKRDGNNSRASSPEHSPGYSSPPSEVSSTSGYQSSTACGLLLELDYGDSGSGGLEVPDQTPQGQPNSEAMCTREHWTSFDDVSELAEDCVRLNLDPALNYFPTIACTATATTPGNCPPESSRGNTQARTTRVQVLSKALHSASLHCETTVSVPSADTSAAAATHCLWTRSSNSSLLRTKEISGVHFSPASQVANNACSNLSHLPDYTLTSSDNQTNRRKIDLTKLTSMPNFHDKWLTSQMDSGILKSDVAFTPDLSENTSLMNFERTSVAGIISEKQKFLESSRNVQIPRSQWESFDSSPPSRPVSPSSGELLLPAKCSLDLPIDSLFSLQSKVHNASYPFSKLGCHVTSPASSAGRQGLSGPLPGAVSPITAFLDSCLTPRSDRENGERNFEFSGRLSGEERNFSTDFNSAVLHSSAKAKIPILKSHVVTDGSKAVSDKSSKISDTTFSRDMANVQNEQKGFPELVR